MKQGQFEQLYGPQWQRFSTLLEALEGKPRVAPKDAAEFGQLYRQVCHFHALAKERNYSSLMVDQLGDLIARGHTQLYRRKYSFLRQILYFVVAEFPMVVCREWRLIALAHLALYGPALLIFIAVLWQPDVVYTVIGPSEVSNFEQMYNPAHRVVGEARDADSNWHMFGFYIYNNISVSFRTFAGGLMLCVGALLLLIYNGLLFGAVAGHLGNAGYTETFGTFVIGHGSFELTAIAISGAAGMKLGWSLLRPGNLGRLEALRRAADDAVKLVYGVIIMLSIAAFIEAFWSSNNAVAPAVKYGVGVFLWAVVVLYLCSGRQRESR